MAGRQERPEVARGQLDLHVTLFSRVLGIQGMIESHDQIRVRKDGLDEACEDLLDFWILQKRLGIIDAHRRLVGSRLIEVCNALLEC